MSAIHEYKCPCCGGAIVFDSTIQKMKCPFCNTEFEIKALEDYYNELSNDQTDDMNWQMTSGNGRQEGELGGLNAYICQSCGGEIGCDENTAATSCPFCGNPVVLAGRLSGAWRPDFVIPFKMDKEAAKAALKKHYERKHLLPKIFKEQNHIDEVKGIYVPFWLFDAGVDVSMRYRATRVRTWSDSRYHYKETKFYAVSRGGKLGFEKVPVDGSSRMPDDLMESIEPFDFSEAVDFQAAYLAGYLADTYDVNAEKSIERANERIRESAENAFNETVNGYTTVIRESCSIRLKNSKAICVLFPVWLLSTTWNGRNYLFAMNGQTGRMVGDLPMDKAAYIRWLSGLTGIMGMVLFAVSYLFWLS